MRARLLRDELTRARHWLLLGMALCGAAVAGSPPTSAPQGAPQSASPGPRPAPSESPPDVDFIEFLGTDDMSDAAWWELLKKAAQREAQRPAMPPQEARQ
jgi:hypothetical protein